MTTKEQHCITYPANKHSFVITRPEACNIFGVKFPSVK